MDHRPPLAVSPRRLRPRPHRVQRPPLLPSSSSSSVKTPPGSIKKAATPMRASICTIPSPVRFEPSPLRASVSALPSPIRLEPSPMRASVSALPPPRLETSQTRAKLDFPAAALSPARAAWEKEDLLAAGVDHDERVALDLAALARAASPVAGPLFVRGRLYDLYSARRNERLKRKHGFPYGGGEWEAADAEDMAEDPCVAVELSKRRVAMKASTGAGGESVRRSMPAADFAAGRASGGLAPRSSLRSSKEMKKATAASVAVKERMVNPRSSARRI